MTVRDPNHPPPFTPLWEQRLIRATKRGDGLAEAQLLSLYEPMVRRITGSLYLPGGEHAQRGSRFSRPGSLGPRMSRP